MTGETILRRGLQIQHATSIQMTFRASYICMFASQIKCEYGMVEIISELIHSIMTGKAICPEGQGMRLGEDNVHFTVAVLAGVGCEGFYIISMTITASERFIRHLELMPIQ